MNRPPLSHPVDLPICFSLNQVLALSGSNFEPMYVFYMHVCTCREVPLLDRRERLDCEKADLRHRRRRVTPGDTDKTACETTANASERPRTYCAALQAANHWLALASIGGRVERAMGIEPTGTARPELESKRFRAKAGQV
jgi:hypothetical protein